MKLGGEGSLNGEEYVTERIGRTIVKKSQVFDESRAGCGGHKTGKRELAGRKNVVEGKSFASTHLTRQIKWDLTLALSKKGTM